MKQASKSFYNDISRVQAYEKRIIKTALTLYKEPLPLIPVQSQINHHNKNHLDIYFVSKAIDLIIDDNSEQITNLDILMSIYPHKKLSKHLLLQLMLKKKCIDDSVTVIYDKNEKTNFTFIADLYNFSMLNTILIKNKILFTENQKISDEFRLHTRQKHCDGSFNIEGVDRPFGIDMKHGNPKSSNATTLYNLLTTDTQIVGILNEPRNIASLINEKIEMFHHFSPYFSANFFLDSQVKELINILEKNDINLKTKISIFHEKQILILQYCKSLGIKCPFNPEFFIIKSYSPENLLTLKTPGIICEGYCENLNSRALGLYKVIQKSEPSLLKNMLTYKNTDWAPAPGILNSINTYLPLI